MTTPTAIKALVGALLIILSGLGLVSPDDASNEELGDTIVAGIGAVILLVTPKVTRHPAE